MDKKYGVDPNEAEYKKKAADPNAGDYRESVFQINPPLNSIGALVMGDNLQLLPSGTEYKIVANDSYALDNLDQFMGKIITVQSVKLTGKPIPTDQLPHISDGYKFKAFDCIVNGTCFYLGDGLIATAGHCVFDQHTATLKTKLMGMKVIFGLTSVAISLGITTGNIPKNRVFSIQRVLFGQDVAFLDPGDNKTSISNRADWAILKLQPDPVAILPPPLTIKCFTPQEQVDGAWLAGHPWGIGLTLAKPPNNSGFCVATGTNAVKHNLLTAPANSGGPIFNSQNHVIAVAVSGSGDDISNRGFVYLGGKEIIPFQTVKEFKGTQINVFSCLFQKRGKFFLACQLPVVPPPAPPTVANTITVKILHGEGNDPNHWLSFDLALNHVVPHGNNNLQLTAQFAPLPGGADRPWQFNIRGLSFTYNYPDGGLVIPQIQNLIFGCFAENDGPNVQNWVVLCKGMGPTVFPGTPETHSIPMFLRQEWKDVDGNGLMGLFNTRAPGL